jgi:predicted GNAT family N-acyltransferase
MDEKIVILNSDSAQLQAAFDLRLEVFVVEQRVPLELEIDEYDPSATHLVMLQGDEVVATLRLVPYGDKIKIGRVAVRQQCRRQGLGTQLMLRGIRHAAESGFRAVFLDAQVDSMPFYRGLGFIAEGDVFDDAGIPHMRMVLNR